MKQNFFRIYLVEFAMSVQVLWDKLELEGSKPSVFDKVLDSCQEVFKDEYEHLKDNIMEIVQKIPELQNTSEDDIMNRIIAENPQILEEAKKLVGEVFDKNGQFLSSIAKKRNMGQESQ